MIHLSSHLVSGVWCFCSVYSTSRGSCRSGCLVILCHTETLLSKWLLAAMLHKIFRRARELSISMFQMHLALLTTNSLLDVFEFG